MILATPIRIFGLRPAASRCFALAVAFAWALIRPSVLPPFALLVMGLFLDVFWGGPQGLWPLCLLATYAVVLLVRRLILSQDFIIMWASYAAAIAVGIGVGYALMTMESATPPNVIAVMLALPGDLCCCFRSPIA